MNVIATWMYCSPEDEQINYCQVGNANDKRVQLLYWKCVFLLFESSARLNKDVRHILFINQPPPEKIEHVPTAALVRQYGIELVFLKSITKTPPDYYSSWNTQFIVLDALDWLKENVGKDDVVFLLDSDIIFNKPINSQMIDDVRKYKALLYSFDCEKEEKINGLTPLELLTIAKEINSSFPDDNFVYSGGEFVCCLGNELAEICSLARDGYEKCLERHQKGQKKFNEEAHLLSYVYHLKRYKTHTANKYIKRIWTERRIFCNVSGDENDLILWHLPAEKRYGFRYAFKKYRKQGDLYILNIHDFAGQYRIRQTLFSKLYSMAQSIYGKIRSFIK